MLHLKLINIASLILLDINLCTVYLIIRCIQLKYYNKKGHPLRVEGLQGLSTETVYLGHSAYAEDTILAGGSAASPKAPPYGSL